MDRSFDFAEFGAPGEAPKLSDHYERFAAQYGYSDRGRQLFIQSRTRN